jgi:pimeloyl-ACP methyl ester carboxylesterase
MLQKLVPADAPAFVRARLQSMIERTPVETILADLAGLAQRPDRMHALRATTFPVLACSGALDALTPPGDARAMADAAGARGSLAIVDGAGHMLPMEKPAEFAAAIAAFWRANGSVAASA